MIHRLLWWCGVIAMCSFDQQLKLKEGSKEGLMNNETPSAQLVGWASLAKSLMTIFKTCCVHHCTAAQW